MRLKQTRQAILACRGRGRIVRRDQICQRADRLLIRRRLRFLAHRIVGGNRIGRRRGCLDLRGQAAALRHGKPGFLLHLLLQGGLGVLGRLGLFCGFCLRSDRLGVEFGPCLRFCLDAGGLGHFLLGKRPGPFERKLFSPDFSFRSGPGILGSDAGIRSRFGFQNQPRMFGFGGFGQFEFLFPFGGQPGLFRSLCLRAFGLGDPGLFERLLPLGGDARLIGRLGFGRGFRLRAGPGTFRREPGPLVFRGPRPFDGDQPRLLGLQLVALGQRQLRIEALGIGREEEIPRFPGADALGQFIVRPDRLTGIAGRGDRGRGDQREILAAERTVDERLLPVACGLQHLVAGETERFAQVEPGFRQILDQCGRERAVLAVAIGCRRSGLCRKRNQGVGATRIDLGQAAPDRARGDGPLHALAERIIAAGIQDDQP